MSLWGRKKAWELVPPACSIGLAPSLEMQCLMQGTSSLALTLCFGDVITAVEISLADSVVHFAWDCLLWGQSKLEEAYKGRPGNLDSVRNNVTLLDLFVSSPGKELFVFPLSLQVKRLGLAGLSWSCLAPFRNPFRTTP